MLESNNLKRCKVLKDIKVGDSYAKFANTRFAQDDPMLFSTLFVCNNKINIINSTFCGILPNMYKSLFERRDNYVASTT